MSRALSILLCIAILVGAVLVARSQSRLSHLRVEYERLTAAYGILEVNSPDKYYVERLESENDRDFLWRIYSPRVIGFIQQFNSGKGGSSQQTSGFEDGGESLFRCHLVKTDSGINAHLISISGSSVSRLDKPLSDFLDEYWADLEFEVISDGEYAADEVLRFLTVRVPPKLLEKLLERPRGKYYTYLAQQPVFEVLRGTQNAFAKAKAQAKRPKQP